MGKINRVHISCSPLVQHVHNNGTISHRTVSHHNLTHNTFVNFQFLITFQSFNGKLKAYFTYKLTTATDQY